MYGYEHDIRGSQKRRASEKEQWLVLDGTCQVRTSRTASPRAMGIFGPTTYNGERDAYSSLPETGFALNSHTQNPDYL